jgi:hypothetical protein
MYVCSVWIFIVATGQAQIYSADRTLTVVPSYAMYVNTE